MPAMNILLAAWIALAFAAPQEFDLLIQGGSIVDGTGNPSFRGDIAIKGGKIAAMGKIRAAKAGRAIDASGLTVAPGFIDIHNHSDYTLLTDGNAESMIRQGVTSMILGEGGSAAPSGGKQEGASGAEASADFAEYFGRLLRQGIATNVGGYGGP